MFGMLSCIRANFASLLLFLLLLITAQDCYSALKGSPNHHNGVDYTHRQHGFDGQANKGSHHINNDINNKDNTNFNNNKLNNVNKADSDREVPFHKSEHSEHVSFASQFDTPKFQSQLKASDKAQDKDPGFANAHSVPKYLPDCSGDQAIRSRNLLLISTLDGNLSAIDAIGGKLLWTSRIADSILSSTISDFMVNAIGETVRIVPSLDGNLFVHNGKTIKQTQYSAEKLLKKSLKFTENVILVGGKESQALGVDLNTGKIVYECGLKSCTPGDNYTRENVIVVRRNFQSIRAINIVSGTEDWHYQVNDPEMVMVSKPNCQGSSKDGEHGEEEQFRIDYKVVIPCGIIRTQVYKSNHSDSAETLSHNWNHKFGIPIVKLWHLKEGEPVPVDLFDKKIVEISDAVEKETFEEPQLYIGSFKNQLYVQKSKDYRETVQEIQADQSVLIKQDILNEKNTAIIQVQWKPKLGIEGPGVDMLPGMADTENETLHEMATVSGFPFLAFNREDSTGYYVFRVKARDEDELCDRLPKTDNETLLNELTEEYNNQDSEPIQQMINIVINNSLMDYWKEILCICVGSWFIFNQTWKIIKIYLKHKLIGKNHKCLNKIIAPEEPKKIEHEISVQTDSLTLTANATMMAEETVNRSNQQQPEPESVPAEPAVVPFNSRFYEDFVPVSQLGKGGFGVVFEAKHKIDGRKYAVKRVAMPTKEEKREKVKREVTCLSVLEHPGIVRYYSAWIENPPPGWQDDKDQEWSFEFSKMEADTYVDETESLISDTGTGNFNQFGKNLCNSVLSDDSLISFRNDDKGDGDNDSLVSFRNDDDNDSLVSFRNDGSERKAGEEITSGSETDDEEEDDDEVDVGVDENDDKKDDESDRNEYDEDSDIVQVGASISGVNSVSHVNWDISVINKHSKEEKRRSRKNSEKDCDKKPKAKIYVYIQMELCKKITLKDWLMDTELRKQDEWLSIFKQILCAVDYVHEKKLIHRDLKPSNIFFSMDGTVKIGDFGLVTSILDDLSDEETSVGSGRKPLKSIKHTNEVGTHIYMSPEQIKKQPYNHKVDIFSIGIILYELLDKFNTESERFRKLQNVRRKEFPAEFQNLYQNECKILDKLLSPKPEDRPEAKEILMDRMFQNCVRKSESEDQCYCPEPTTPTLNT